MNAPRGKRDPKRRILIGIPMTGLLRSEWHLAYISQIIPCNWSQALTIAGIDQYSPIQFVVADARNIIVEKAVREDFEWLFFLDHDVVLPVHTFSKFNEYMLAENVPIVGGLYFTKSAPSEPLIYRGRGNSYYTDWKLGQKVWVDGMGLGCHLIHGSILKTMWEASEEYQIQPGVTVRRVFDTPSQTFVDPEGHTYSITGTEDLPWYEKIIEKRIFRDAGWNRFDNVKNPFLCDTSIFCKHIDWNGLQYPAHGEEKNFE